MFLDVLALIHGAGFWVAIETTTVLQAPQVHVLYGLTGSGETTKTSGRKRVEDNGHDPVILTSGRLSRTFCECVTPSLVRNDFVCATFAEA